MAKKRKRHSVFKEKKSPKSLDRKILENLVSLQKVHTDLAVKFDKLSKDISNLLTLFEVTAQSFAKNLPTGEIEKDKEFLDKIDKLLDQNKTIAKGLTLMEEHMKERVYGGAVEKKPEEMRPSLNERPRPLPRF